MADREPTDWALRFPCDRGVGLLFGAVFALVAGWPLLFGGKLRA